MPVVDLTSMNLPQQDRRSTINNTLELIRVAKVDLCFQCTKCTSGCEAMKLLELEPHKIVALAKAGYIDELMGNDVIWTCMVCFKCKERCPQKVSPVEVLFLIKNMNLVEGKEVPGEYSNWLQTIMGMGMIMSEQPALTKDGSTVERSDLGLPPAPAPEDMEKFMNVVMMAAMELMV